MSEASFKVQGRDYAALRSAAFGHVAQLLNLGEDPIWPLIRLSVRPLVVPSDGRKIAIWEADVTVEIDDA